jgi:tetratricopeptide (TPR) repeat protein
MLPEITPKLTTAELLQLIEEARNAEICRDTESLRKVLREVWIDTNVTPDFQNYGDIINAELLRLCGVFLSLYGKYSLNLKNYQSRGKDLLTSAIRIFEANNLPDKAAEANVMLAFCYWNAGEVSECEAILNTVEANFRTNQLHPVYLQICLNRLLICFWNGDIRSALQTIEEIKTPVQLCSDLRLQVIFHNQAGIFYRADKQYEKGIFHLNKGIRLAKKINNQLYVAINLNNLAYLYKETKDFQKAVGCISESIDEVNKIEHQGFLPHALDTKALIYLDWNKPEKALETIDQAIDYFGQGEDYRGLTDALWTKVRCLLRLGRLEDALVIFGELYKIAAEQIGEVAVRKFAKNLADEIFVLRHLPLADEVTAFKKSQVTKALIEANGSIVKATKILQLKNHQTLSDILNKFPGLVEELGFRRRVRRGSSGAKSESSNSRTVTLDKSEIHHEREISRLVLQNKSFSFDFPFSSDKFETFYFDKYLMQKFGVDCGAIVAVIPVEEFSEGLIVLVSNEDVFTIAKVEYDGWAEIYFISDERGMPVPLDEENVIGEPVGYCLMESADKRFIEFSRLG